MVCGTDYFDIWQTEPGACDHAELTDKGPGGAVLRAIKKLGGFSRGDSPEQHAPGGPGGYLEKTLRLLRLTNGF
jgi:hypothetical protein